MHLDFRAQVKQKEHVDTIPKTIPTDQLAREMEWVPIFLRMHTRCLKCLRRGGERANERHDEVQSSRRCKQLPVRRMEEEPGCLWNRYVASRGTGMTVFAYLCFLAFSSTKGCARVTGKAGENGQFSGKRERHAHFGHDRRLPGVVTS